jgi:mannose-1-phosphate guanylyltransferase/mannose-6-phosphate isomerase
MKLVSVVLSGGAGTRLWPASRQAYPKPFMKLGGQPLLAQAIARGQACGTDELVVITNQDYLFLTRNLIEEFADPPNAHFLLEPQGRNTGPAIALATLYCESHYGPDAVMLVLPADHDIPDDAAFAATVSAGLGAAAGGHLVIFGIEPRWPETGYGYIERGEALDGSACFRVASFVEKPELEIAQRLVASGRHFWNGGMFLFGVRAFLEELERFEPELAAWCKRCVAPADPSRRGDDFLIDPAVFSACNAISVDHAVLERTTRAAMVPATFAWSDIGSWEALWDRAAKDRDGNECHGDVQLHDVRGSLVRANHRLVVGIGLEDVVVVETPDAVLVARRSETQRVREAVEQLKARGRGESRQHRRVARPWGTYEDIDQGERFRVKRITVAPGEKLSLQYHHHRAEHWIIVSGTARVTRGEDQFLLTENQSIYIEVGQVHRLENPGKVPLQLIEVQTGGYLGEDDIVRLEDIYQRVPASAARTVETGGAA